MELTLDNVKNIYMFQTYLNETKLEQYVLDWIADRWNDYENKKYIFLDVLDHGCRTGCVTQLIYTSDCVKFYEKYENEIVTLVYDLVEETGEWNLHSLFSDWDKYDIFAREMNNQTILAWYGFEETLRRIAKEFDELKNEV